MIAGLIVRLLGRRLAWRLGRAVYMAARGEVANDIATNGEAALVRNVMRAAAAGRPLVFWDVGANLGAWTQKLIEAGREADRVFTAHLFEPVPATQAELSKRFGHDSRISLHGVALSRQQGIGRMQIVSATGGTNALINDAPHDANTIAVMLETGDVMRERLGQIAIDLIKIDAEGHDLDILRGFSSTLANGAAGVVQFEYNHRWVVTGASLFQVFGLIEGTPYRLGRVSPDGIVMLPGWHPEVDRYLECNYALVRDDMVARLEVIEARWDESNVLIAA